MRAATLPAILVALGSATGFEALTVPATQIKAVRAVSPWQDDPYDVFVSFAMVAVALLAVVIAARLAVWRAPGGADRPRQTARAAGALVTLSWTALAFAWAAVAAGAGLAASALIAVVLAARPDGAAG